MDFIWVSDAAGFDMQRDYDALENGIFQLSDRRQCMQSFVDVVWESLCLTGISWIGFYQHLAADELTLGPCRDKPACSPIGMQGVCGQALQSRRPRLVGDVSELGDQYIACDPRDRSEVVIPLFEASGRCWGVLDVDSHQVGAFSEEDVRGLTSLLRRARLMVDQEGGQESTAS